MSKRAVLAVLALLFFGPLVVAWIWFFHFEEQYPGTVNKGELIDPPVAIGEAYLRELRLHAGDADETAQPFSDDWSIVLLAPRSCEMECEQALYLTRQVRIRLNKDADRVQRVLLAGEGVEYPAEQHPDLRVFAADAAALAPFVNAAPDARIWLVDPRGFLMMSYPAGFTPEMLHADLKRLLKYSDAD